MYGLPASLLLLQDEDVGGDAPRRRCIGHARISDCFEGYGGAAAAVTYVLVDEGLRGQRLGTKLMELVEAEAKRLGYHYLYLWTKDAAPFYRRCGYMVCERVSLHKPCLAGLEQSQLAGLERMLAGRLSKKPVGTESAAEPAATLFADVAGAEDVWLRKRLAESVASVEIPLAEQESQIKAGLEARGLLAPVERAKSSAANDPEPGWCYLLNAVPWQRQIGPSCGLAALRMARDFLMRRRAGDAAKAPGSGAESPLSPPLYTARFSEEKWGMSCRLVAGPITVTRVNPDGEALREGVKVGDVIVRVDGVTVAADRPEVVRRVRAGGEATLELERAAQARPGMLAGALGGSSSAAAACPSLLAAARERKFTVDGEIFDIEHLNTLAREVCGIVAEVGLLSTTPVAAILAAVGEGDILVVPYDAHPGSKMPAQLGGHGAHYCVITGACVRQSKAPRLGLTVAARAGPGLSRASTVAPALGNDAGLDVDADDGIDVLMVAQHSTSERLLLTSYRELAVSNAQLTAFDATRFSVETLNLADKFLLLRGLAE